MPLHSWRRDHDSDIVARVDPADDARWIVSIWQGASCVKTLRRRFQLLTEAHARADEEVLEAFPHPCGTTHASNGDTARCGRRRKRRRRDQAFFSRALFPFA